MWSACTILHTWARENLFSLNLVHHWHTCFVLHMLKPIELHHVKCDAMHWDSFPLDFAYLMLISFAYVEAPFLEISSIGILNEFILLLWCLDVYFIASHIPVKLTWCWLYVYFVVCPTRTLTPVLDIWHNVRNR